MRVLLVPVSDRPESRTALTVACGLADKFAANLLGAHLLPDRDASSRFKTRGLPLFGSTDEKWLARVDTAGTDSSATRSRRLFADIVKDAGLRQVGRWSHGASRDAAWLDYTGVPNQFMATCGPLADLIVLTRPARNSKFAYTFLHAALLNASRPVLMLPPSQKRVPGKRIVIAWNQSHEAAHVVSGCMPMLQAAEAVSIVSCGQEARPGPKASQLQAYLKCYGVKTRVLASRGKDEEQELLDACKASESDLLLMGARSHVRFRELGFGNMTDFMLHNAKIPIVLQHAQVA